MAAITNTETVLNSNLSLRQATKMAGVGGVICQYGDNGARNDYTVRNAGRYTAQLRDNRTREDKAYAYASSRGGWVVSVRD